MKEFGEETAGNNSDIEQNTGSITDADINVEITITNSPFINLALYQKNFQPITDITFTSTRNDLEDITITVSNHLNVFTPLKLKADLLQKNETISISNNLKKLVLNPAVFAELTENLKSSIDVEIFDSRNRSISKKSQPVEITAFNQWTGDPELLASFITPNSPAVPAIITKAEEKLRTLVANSDNDIKSVFSTTRGFLGYREDEQYAVLEAEALYLTLLELNISYRLPPASFFTAQRIRIFNMVIQEKTGTCLDTSCFYAALLEAVGLYPVLCVFEDHAFTGVILSEETDLIDTVTFERSEIFRAIEMQKILPVETTCITEEGINFSKAVNSAKQIFSDSKFKYCVNIKACRQHHIKPLPTISKDQGGSLVLNDDPRFTNNINLESSSIQIRKKTSDLSIHEKLTKEEQWENKLLDLTTRNRLLNMRTASGTVLRILNDKPEHLEDTLRKYEDKYFRLVECNLDESLIKDGFNSETMELSGNLQSLTSEFLDGNKALYVLNKTGRQLPQLLKKIASDAKTSYDENGANSLFISLYSVLWSDDTYGKKQKEAPLLLLPVDIKRDLRNDVYSIKVRDEEAVLNYSLVEMMRQLFGINLNLDKLPNDDYGVDVVAIKDTFQKVLPQDWKILKTVCLGNFSFRKFVMWQDLAHNRCLLKSNSPVYNALQAGKFTEIDKFGDTETPRTVDERILFGDLCQPVQLDSSQLDALKAADSGKSFVLQGPPGTGKSQTITSIIASALNKNKKVLFVAAKMAALEVVQDRLGKLGLAPYCLELHSNLLTKSKFLEKLEIKAPEKENENPSAEYTVIKDRLNTLRDELNRQVAALHSPVIMDMSVYKAMCRLSHLKISTVSLLSENEIKQINHKQIDDADTALREIGILTKDRKLSEYTYYGSSLTSVPQTSISVDSTEYSRISKELIKCSDLLSEFMKTDQKEMTWERLKNVIESACDLTSDSNINCSLITVSDWNNFVKMADRALQLSSSVHEAMKTLGSNGEDIFQLNIRNEIKQWKLDETKFILLRLFCHSRSIQKLKKALGVEIKIDSSTYPGIMETGLKVIGWREELKELSLYLETIDHNLTQKIIKTPAEALKIVDILKVAHSAVSSNLSSSDKKKIFSAIKLNDVEDIRSRFEEIAAFKDVMRKFENYSGKIIAWSGIQKEYIPTHITDLISKTEDWLEKKDEIQPWIEINLRLEILKVSGFNVIADDLMHIRLTNYPDGYVSAVYAKSLIEWQFSQNQTLASFNKEIFEDKIKRFVSQTGNFNQLSRDLLKENLRKEKAEIANDPSLKDEIIFFEKAKKSRGRNISIRQIFSNMPNLMPKIAPCMLMSPISVAQYLSPDKYKFDLIIFDEASQLPTSEAVGAIGRGTQVIIVGDPKQMPPTEFFEAKREEDEDTADLESVLDDCIALGMPMKTLSWHYRSRHESLIAFSNTMYYDGGLYTFPSPDDMNSKITYRYVNGRYDRGGTGTNKDESREVISYIKQFLEDPKNENISIGVVTFNSKQQNQIEDDLTNLFRSNPQLEAEAEKKKEPIFIKNLENVQGDERDIIIFSVGFGKDKFGKISMNFGPLNREGGERRLNVALTRAKREMIIFTSLEYEDGRITASTAKGVSGLFDFLKYARQGKINSATQLDSKKMEKDYLISELAAELKKHGYETNSGLGSSDFRIDLAVKDPEDPEKYIAGIMADGIVYKNTPCAVDRFVGQPGILKDLGWKIIRFWTSEWKKNPQAAVKSIIEALQK
jgi:DNA polymerase III delta prime subunit